MNLLPHPRKLQTSDGVFALDDSHDVEIMLIGSHTNNLWFSANRLALSLQSHGFGCTIGSNSVLTQPARGITLNIDSDKVHHVQGYALEIHAESITVTGGSTQGVFYGVCTLLQLISIHWLIGRLVLPCLHIADHPDFPVRGLMLDISRDKVPKLSTLLDLIDRLASLKINQLHLYAEHTFAYRAHRDVWQDASPFTAAEIQQVDFFCRARHVELVPCTNSFGHFHRWLKKEAYSHLAETHGPYTAWGRQRQGPFGLNPLHPESIALLRSLYDELLPNFSSGLFNVGCDETIDLGFGASADEVLQKGRGRVYLDFVQKIYLECTKRQRTMMFWGDIIINYPELVAELPKDAIALEWGYEFDHPFDKNSALFAASGIPFYVCPGTASWNSFAGRTQNALGNLLNAAESGLKHGAVGYLITDWGDFGHWQPQVASMLGYGFGAAVSWTCDANKSIQIADAISRHLFDDVSGTVGAVAFDIGNVYQSFKRAHNGNPVVFVMNAPVVLRSTPAEVAQKMAITREQIGQHSKSIDQSIKPLHKHKMTRPDADLIVDELQMAADWLKLGGDYTLHALGHKVNSAMFVKKQADLLKRYRKIWLARNRPGGLNDSIKRLKELKVGPSK